MRVLVTWGSKAGGTEGIARIVGEVLGKAGHDVTLLDAARVRDLGPFEAVIVGGALYAFRWHRAARRLVSRQVKALRHVPVWFFSSGPLDASAEQRELPPIDQVEVLMERVGAQGHVTFGGRLAKDAQGFPASAMAKTQAGDWRNPERIRAWAAEVARALPFAAPRRVVEPAGRSPWRLLTHGLVGSAVSTVVLVGLLALAGTGVAITLRALLAPVIFLAVALHYFRAHGPRAPLPTALTFAALQWLLDLAVVAGALGYGLALERGFAGAWLPVLLVFAVTWVTGVVLSYIPARRPSSTTPSAA